MGFFSVSMTVTEPSVALAYPDNLSLVLPIPTLSRNYPELKLSQIPKVPNLLGRL